MTRPTITVSIGFTANPFAALSTVTWTDVTSRLRITPSPNGAPIVTQRGKQGELSPIEAGTLTLTLDNRDRAFDPDYASSPYYPNVKPMRRIRVQATWLGVTYTIFTGYIERWEPRYIGVLDAVVDVTAIDALKLLATADIGTSASPYSDSAAVSNTAIGHLLSQIGWPSSDRYLNGGNTTIPATSYAGVNALQAMQAIAEAEAGTFFVEYDGFVTMHQRYYRLVAQSSPNMTFGTNPATELPFQDVRLSYNDALIANRVHITRTSGTEQIAADSTSQTAYGLRVLSKSGMPLGTDTEAFSLATWLLRKYKDPFLRVDEIVLNGDLSPTQVYFHALVRIIDDRVRVRLSPPGGGSAIQKDGYIIGIRHEISREQWLTTWRLEPADAENYWILGDTTYSVLGTTTIPAY